MKKPNNNYKTEWDFQLFYKNEKDPQIEKDVQVIEKACEEFESKYKSDDSYLTEGASLANILRDYENLQLEVSGKPLDYFRKINDIDSRREYAGAMATKLMGRLTNAHNRLIFFGLKLGKISKANQEKFLNDKTLSHYHYYLKVLFDTSKYDLSEPEEKILSVKYQPAREMWIDGNEKLLSKQTVKLSGKNIPLPEAAGKIPGLPKSLRRKLHQDLMNKYKDVSHFAEAEINAVYTDKKITDELRGAKSPYELTILRYENDIESILKLVETVTKAFPIAHRFYKLKAKLLKEKKLTYADRSAVPGEIKTKFDWNSTQDIVEKAFGKVDLKFANIFRQFIKNGQIDVFPKTGKTGGAYCSSNYLTPTLVLLNHTNDFRSLMTIAHEMGHAFHSELSKSQTPIYQGYSTSVAEVASTLFENFVFDEVFEKLSDKEKIVALHSRINDSVATVFRQIACFNFENELHQVIRSEGFLPNEKIAKLMNKHMGAYLGPAVRLEEIDGYFFVNWSHIRHFFYVYSYAYGELISKALYAKYKEDKNFIKKIEEFLSAGSSKSPYQIFKDIGIDTSDPNFFISGLRSIEQDIEKLEKLTK